MENEENKVEIISQAEIKVETKTAEHAAPKDDVKENEAESKVETDNQELTEVKVEVKEEAKVVEEKGFEEKIILDILEKVKSGEKIKTAVDIISMVMEMVEAKAAQDKLKTALTILEKISISDQGENSELVKSLRMMVENGMIEGIIEGMISVSKGLYHIQRQVNKDSACKCVIF